MPDPGRRRPASTRRLARALRHHADFQPVIGPALASALMNRFPVRTVNRLARIVGCSRSTRDRHLARSPLADQGITLHDVLQVLLLIRAAETPPHHRTWTRLALELGVGEKRLRRACRIWLRLTSASARALQPDAVVAALEVRLGTGMVEEDRADVWQSTSYEAGGRERRIEPIAISPEGSSRNP